jgi:hypothetical protein
MERLNLEASTSGRSRVEAAQLRPRGFPRLLKSACQRRHPRLTQKRLSQVARIFAGIASPAEQKTVPSNGITEQSEAITSTSTDESHMVNVPPEDRQVTTFRWPAALIRDGQTVSVSGTAMFACCCSITANIWGIRCNLWALCYLDRHLHWLG